MFPFDTPVPYILQDGELTIYPILVKDSALFLSSVDILNIDKNSSSDVRAIQLSYLGYLAEYILNTKADASNIKFSNIMSLCLGIHKWQIRRTDKNKYVLIDSDKNLIITAKQFDEIIRIILYQNILHYDDSYIDSDLRNAMYEQDKLSSKDIIIPTTERKMAIISSHCGILKQQQIEMTLRSHQLLFEEVCNEVEYSALKGVSLFGNDSDKIQWIYKRKTNKFDKYITDKTDIVKNMGNKFSYIADDNSRGDMLDTMFNNYKEDN